MKKKIIVSALALTIGTGLAGSITSTIAWYQYSTRTNTAYVGVAGGATGNLNMRIRKAGQAADEDWTTFISKETLKTYLDGQGYGTNIVPVTPGALAKDGALDTAKMVSNPIPGRGEYSKWNSAAKANYLVIPLQLRYVERDGVKENGKDEKNLAEEVYLSELVLEQPTADAATHNDLSEALRFHVAAYDSSAAVPEKTNRLVSKKGGTTVTNGKLDLDGDGKNDTARPEADKYGFTENVDTLTEITYGEGSQVAFTAEELTAPATNRQYYNENNSLVADSEVYSLVAQSREGKYGQDLDDDYLEYDTGKSKAIGSTFAGEEKFLNVDITIWVEGWQKFLAVEGEEGYSSIWNKKFIDTGFNIGFEFGVNSEVDA